VPSRPCGRTETLATCCTAAQSRHLGIGTGLIDEDERVWIKIDLYCKPGFAGRGHVGLRLLGGVRGFF
jgi:hypothetical protein